MTFQITSPAFKNNEMIPRPYTCQGLDMNPRLIIQGVPTATKSLALIVDDPDAPGKTWVHWVVFNIPATSKEIPERNIPGIQGMNDFGQLNFGGPCPPSGTHRYFFKLYALDTLLDLPQGIRKANLEKAMQGHILGQTQLVGLYKKTP